MHYFTRAALRVRSSCFGRSWTHAPYGQPAAGPAISSSMLTCVRLRYVSP